MQLKGISLDDIKLRIERLKVLSMAFSRERLFWPKDNDGLLFNEREPYLDAIGDPESACEKARVILAKAEHRLRKRQRRGSSGSRPLEVLTASPPPR